MITKKIIMKFVVIPVIVLLLALIVGFLVAGNALIKAGIETAGSATLGVPVTVKSVNLSLLRGRVGIKGLAIKNPPGYANDTLLELGEGIINLDVGSLLGDTIKIELIKLDGTKMTMEQKGLTNNLKEILNKLPKEQEPAAPQAQQKGKNLNITKLEIANTTVKVKLLPIPGKSDTVSMNIDTITMSDFGSQNLKVGQLIAKILRAIAVGVAKQGADILPDDMVKGMGSAFEKTAEGGKKIIENSTGAGKDVIKGVTNLFGGKKSEPNK